MTVQFKNNAFSTLATSINDAVTTLAVASGHGARFPTITGSQYFYVTLIDSSNNLEIVKVTARSSDTFTVVRDQESSGNKAFSAGDRVELRLTAQGLNDIAAEVYLDNEFTLQDSDAITKQLRFDCGSVTGGQTRVVTAQDSNLIMAGTNVAQSFSKPQTGALNTLTPGTTVAWDMSDGNNFTLTLEDNSTALSNPTNEVAGTSGSLLLIQDGTGSRVISFGSHYFFAGGTDAVLSTAANAIDRLDYFVQAADKVHCVVTKALA